MVVEFLKRSEVASIHISPIITKEAKNVKKEVVTFVY
jgi:hypothetical protein